jgi:outer membrane protein
MMRTTFKGTRRKPLIGLMGATFLVSQAWCLPASAESLYDAMAAAYNSNPALAAERARLRATDEGVAQAKAGWRPTITATGTVGTVETDTDSAVPIPQFGGKQTVDPITGAVNVTQPLFRGGQTIYGTRRAKESVMAGRENLRNAEQNTLLDAVTAYMDVKRDEAVVELRKKNVAVLRRQLEAAQDRFNVGEITRTDVAQSEARLSLSQSNLIQAEANLTASRAAYQRVIGHAPASLDAPPALPAFPESEAASIEIARANNPVLQAARHAERAADHAIDAAKGTLFPQVSLEAGYSHAEEPSSTTARQDETRVTGRLTIPLYQAGAEYSRVREAKQIHAQNRLQVADTLRQVDESVQNAWEQYRASKAVIRSSTEQVNANEIALDGVRQEEQVGARTTLDVLDAEQELLDSQVQLVSAQRNEYVAGFSLLAAIGGLSVEQIGLDVERYDPQRNYEQVADKWIGWGIEDE